MTVATRIEGARGRVQERISMVRRSVIWMLLSRQRRLIRWLVALQFVQLVATLSLTAATVDMVDNGIVDQAVPLGDYVSYIAQLATLVLVVGFANRQISSRLGYQLEFDLRTWLYTRVQWADLHKLDKLASGQLVTRTMTDLKMLQSIIQFLPAIVTLAPATLALLLFLAYLSLPMALVAATALPLNLWLLSKFRVRLWGLSWAVLNEQAEIASAVDEPVRGVRVMRAFGREAHERSRLRETALRTYRFTMTRVRLLARYDILLKTVPLVINSLTLIIGARLIAADTLTVGVFLVAFQTAGFVTVIAQLLDELASSWQFLRSAQARLSEVLALGARPREGRPAAEHFEGLEMRNAGVTLSGTSVLRDLSMVARPGALVVVTGPPGSGKTTLANLAAGLIGPSTGEVLLDGRPLADLDITTIRRMVRIVTEDPILFSGTLRQNLDLGAAWTVTDDEMEAAIRAAGAEDIVSEMPHGLDTPVGNRGLTLSGGQRQRLALARALVSKPRIVVMDDALSAVNPAYELEILRRVREFLPDSTVLAISRRSGPAAIADSVIHLNTQPLEESATSVEAPLGTTEDGSTSRLMIVVNSLDVSEERPIIADADCEIDEMPLARTLGRLALVSILVVLVLLVVNTVSGLGPELLFSQAADAAEDKDTSQIYLVGLAAVGVGIAFAISGYFMRIAVTKIAQSIVYLLRRRVFLRLTNLGIDFYDRELPGEVAARVVNDLDTILNFLAERIFRFISNITRFVIALVAVIVIMPGLTGTMLTISGIIVCLTVIQLYLGLRAFRRARHDLGRTVATFEEHFGGRSELRACGATEKATQRFVNDAWELRQSRRWATSIANGYSELVAFTTNVGGALILATAGDAVLTGAVTVGVALSARLVSQQALAPLSLMSTIYNEMLDTRVSWDRLSQPFTTPILPVESVNAEEAPPLDGSVTFESVTFTYPYTSRQVLNDVSFTLPAGSVTALVGFTGAGKSSITKLLTRIYDPAGGRILVGDNDILRYDSGSYRRRLGVVPQDAFLFKGTIRSNIAYARPDATIDEVDAAVRAVGAHDVLATLTNGYEHPVDEEARNLTATQRQLVALARVWLAHPDVLILDEATSSLDGALEDRVLNAVRALGVTTLTVTHRPNVAARSDLVIVLDAGRVVEEGSPEELIGKGSAYDSLWSVDGSSPVDSE